MQRGPGGPEDRRQIQMEAETPGFHPAFSYRVEPSIEATTECQLKLERTPQEALEIGYPRVQVSWRKAKWQSGEGQSLLRLAWGNSGYS